MTPQLPADDLKLIEDLKAWDYGNLTVKSLVSIISRLQSALDKCVEQRDMWRQLNTHLKEGILADGLVADNQELQKILDGGE